MTKRSDALSMALEAAARPAFEAFIAEQQPALLGFLRRRMPTEEDAQDVAQECLMRMVRYVGTEPEAAWKPLLYRVATNAACDHARWRSARHGDGHVSLEDEALISPAPLPDDLAEQHQELAILEAAILRLSPKCQQAFLLHRMEGFTYAQIADHMAISERMVQKHISKALAVLAAVSRQYFPGGGR